MLQLTANDIGKQAQHWHTPELLLMPIGAVTFVEVGPGKLFRNSVRALMSLEAREDQFADMAQDSDNVASNWTCYGDAVGSRRSAHHECS